jgi:hypothetical protein
LFKEEQAKKWYLFCDVDFCRIIADGFVCATEKYHQIELSDDDVDMCKEIIRIDDNLRCGRLPKLSSKYGDFFNIWTWNARYTLMPMEGSYRRFLAQRGVKESFDTKALFEKVWKALDKRHGWNKEG